MVNKMIVLTVKYWTKICRPPFHAKLKLWNLPSCLPCGTDLLKSVMWFQIKSLWICVY